MKRGSLFWYGVVILVSLCIIFFVGKSVDPTTGNSKTIFTTNGIQHFRKGMDVAWWVRLTYKIDLSTYESVYANPQEFSQVTKGVKDIILQNIDSRISSLWVSDYRSYIQSLSDGEYIVVEIWWVFDLDQAKDIIWKTVELEFKTQFEGEDAEIRQQRQLIAENFLKEATTNPGSFFQLASNRSSENIYYQVYPNASLSTLPQIYQDNPEILQDRLPGSVYPTLVQWVYTELPSVDGVSGWPTVLEGWLISKFNGSRTVTWAADSSWNVTTTTLYDLEEIFVEYTPAWITAKDPVTNEILNGAFFRMASVGQSQTGQPVAIIQFDDRWKEIFCNLTEQIVGRPMAIFVWGELTTSPVIREKICGWSAQIDGGFTPETARSLVDDLNEWALPAPLILSHEEKVSASLWEKALQWALIAWLVWLVAIFVFMLVMYWPKQWTVAITTLVAFLIVLFALIKLFGYALSLSGIAAILLSIGMGVDANVLIYERVREELKLNKSISNAINDGYNRSRSAIRDGNFTTFMVALLLFFMGTNVFKWFGTMMMINIILTLSVIVPLTKHMLFTLYKSEK